VLQQGVAADFHSELPQEPRSDLSSKSERRVGEPVILPVGASRVVTYGPGEPLGEDSSLAGFLIAEKPSDVQAQGDGYSLPGKVRERSAVARRDPVGKPAAQRASGLRSSGTGDERDAPTSACRQSNLAFGVG
jgi:hypothetical protein